MLKNHIKNSYFTAYETVKNFVENDENIEKTVKISEELAEAYRNGNKSLIYNFPFSYMDACKSIFMYICLLFILLVLIITQQDRRCKYGNK